jgi:hypothetical protein
MTTTATHVHTPSRTYLVSRAAPTLAGTVRADITKCVCGETVGRYEFDHPQRRADRREGPWVPAVRTDMTEQGMPVWALDSPVPTGAVLAVKYPGLCDGANDDWEDDL